MASSTTAPPTQRTGSCLCGAVQIKITGEPVLTNLCHCSSCQKSSGSVFASLAVFQTEQLEYTFTTPDILKTYTDGSPRSGNVIERSFCGICGARVKNVGSIAKGQRIALPTGVIDGDKADLKPKVELFCANREEWLADFEGTTAFVTMPNSQTLTKAK